MDKTLTIAAAQFKAGGLFWLFWGIKKGATTPKKSDAEKIFRRSDKNGQSHLRGFEPPR
jgi:hypothetical protein